MHGNIIGRVGRDSTVEKFTISVTEIVDKSNPIVRTATDIARGSYEVGVAALRLGRRYPNLQKLTLAVSSVKGEVRPYSGALIGPASQACLNGLLIFDRKEGLIRESYRNVSKWSRQIHAGSEQTRFLLLWLVQVSGEAVIERKKSFRRPVGRDGLERMLLELKSELLLVYLLGAECGKLMRLDRLAGSLKTDNKLVGYGHLSNGSMM